VARSRIPSCGHVAAATYARPCACEQACSLHIASSPGACVHPAGARMRMQAATARPYARALRPYARAEHGIRIPPRSCARLYARAEAAVHAQSMVHGTAPWHGTSLPRATVRGRRGTHGTLGLLGAVTWSPSWSPWRRVTGAAQSLLCAADERRKRRLRGAHSGHTPGPRKSRAGRASRYYLGDGRRQARAQLVERQLRLHLLDLPQLRLPAAPRMYCQRVCFYRLRMPGPCPPTARN
jgi:hypothetical protein